MNPLQFRPIIYFSLVLFVFWGCARTLEEPFSHDIQTLNMVHNSVKTYGIFIDNIRVGTNTLTIRTNILKSFHTISYRCVALIEDIHLMDATTQTITYLKPVSNGYIFLSDDYPNLTKTYIPLPITKNSAFFGPFSAITTDPVSLTAVAVHKTFVTYTGLVFDNVIEARSATNQIRVFINSDHFIIQREDYRYRPTIQTLLLPS
jgi:hypothetical protein